MSDQTFHIGLCMAGAVSAGAYTAGVMDYLTEALAEWEKRRGNAGVPTHKVVISVIGGSSAGGMTGIITGAAVNQPLSPVAVPPPEQLLENRPDNLFYHTWVDLLNDDMFSLPACRINKIVTMEIDARIKYTLASYGDYILF